MARFSCFMLAGHGPLHYRGRGAAKLINSFDTFAAGGFAMSEEESCSDGGCTCRFVRYRMTGTPLFVHCCHCRWCQRETGSAFALNAMIEADRVRLLEGHAETILTPSLSGKG